VAVGGEPVGVAVADNRVYVATTSSGCDSVVVVDADARSAIAVCPLAYSISGIAVSPDRKRVYVSRTGDHVADVAVIDVVTEKISTIRLATGPGVIAETVRISPDGQRLYAAICDQRGDSLITAETETKRVRAALRMRSPIRDIAVSPDGKLAYVLVANPRRGGVVKTVDTTSNRIVETLEIGGWPTHLALSPEGTVAVGATDSVTTLSVAPTATVPGVQAMAMHVLAAPTARELQAAAV
jgi:DNA-binding beta-propeller fold protein YncE